MRGAAWLAAALLAGAPSLSASPSDGAAPALLLPPMLVRDHHNSALWRYGRIGNLEVLSQCDDRTTTAFVTAYRRRQLELEQLLPARLQLQQSAPIAIILITPAVQRTMREELVKTMNQRAQQESSGYVTPVASAWQVYRLVREIPQLTLYDAESTGLVCTLDPAQRGPVAMSGEAAGFFNGLANDGTYSDMNFTMGRMGVLLGGRRPPLPSWFKSGFLALYREINWTTHSDTIAANPVFWVSNALTKQIRRNPSDAASKGVPFSLGVEQFKPDRSGGPDSNQIDDGPSYAQDVRIYLLPMRKFFAGPAALSPEESSLWSAQASLFLHWAYSDPQRRESLWRFADLASRQPVTEDLIRQGFGMSSGRLGQTLLAYLPLAVKSPLPLINVASISVPPLQLRDASYVEAARIKGDMGRKEIAYVNDRDSTQAAQYVQEVGAVLHGPLEDSAHDPAELAVLGLYDCEQGKNEEALPLLEQAAAAHIARPTLYIELAKIRLAKAAEQPAGPDGKLGPEQVAGLIGLVRESQQYAPAQAEGYLLAADIWSRGELTPSHENLAMLTEGVELFPENFDLVAAGAKLYAANGFQPEAVGLVDHALGYADPNSGMRTRLLDLRAQVMAPPSP